MKLSALHWPLWIPVAAILVGSIGAAWFTEEWLWVSRGGSAVVAVGVLMEGWPLLKINRSNDSPGWLEDKALRAIQNLTLVIVLGTLVNGYGDVVAKALAEWFGKRWAGA